MTDSYQWYLLGLWPLGLLVVLLLLVLGVSWMTRNRGPKDPQIDPEASHYLMQRRCGNCGCVVEFWFAKGVPTASQPRVIAQCKRCNCVVNWPESRGVYS